MLLLCIVSFSILFFLELGHITEYNMKKVKVLIAHHVQLFVTPWTMAYQTSLSMEFSRQEYWGG